MIWRFSNIVQKKKKQLYKEKIYQGGTWYHLTFVCLTIVLHVNVSQEYFTFTETSPAAIVRSYMSVLFSIGPQGF